MALQKILVPSPHGTIEAFEIVSFAGGSWIVQDWTISPDGRERRPHRIISVRMAQTGEPVANPELLELFQKVPELTAALFADEVPSTLSKAVVTRRDPELWLPTPEALN